MSKYRGALFGSALERLGLVVGAAATPPLLPGEEVVPALDFVDIAQPPLELVFESVKVVGPPVVIAVDMLVVPGAPRYEVNPRQVGPVCKFCVSC